METLAADITQRILPCEIVEDFGVAPESDCPSFAYPIVFEERDVSNFQTSWAPNSNITIVGFTGFETYVHAISCEVQVSFIVPANK